MRKLLTRCALFTVRNNYKTTQTCAYVPATGPCLQSHSFHGRFTVRDRVGGPDVYDVRIRRTRPDISLMLTP